MWLINQKKLDELSETDGQDGDLVFYFEGGKFKHVGIFRSNGRVLSKWGRGHLYHHELWEVPSSYGDDLKYYRRLSFDAAFALFVRFAEENGLRFEPEPVAD